MTTITPQLLAELKITKLLKDLGITNYTDDDLEELIYQLMLERDRRCEV